MQRGLKVAAENIAYRPARTSLNAKRIESSWPSLPTQGPWGSSQCKEDWKWETPKRRKGTGFLCLNAKRIERMLLLFSPLATLMGLNAKRIESELKNRFPVPEDLLSQCKEDWKFLAFFQLISLWSASQCKEDWKFKLVPEFGIKESKSQCKEDWK